MTQSAYRQYALGCGQVLTVRRDRLASPKLHAPGYCVTVTRTQAADALRYRRRELATV